MWGRLTPGMAQPLAKSIAGDFSCLKNLCPQLAEPGGHTADAFLPEPHEAKRTY